MNTELRSSYDAAIEYLAQIRGTDITPFDRTVADSVFSACTLALEDWALDMAQYRLVPAPTGSGKSSCALAFIKALIETIPQGSALYLVETCRHADDVYTELVRLIGQDRVAVWTSAHDVGISADTALREHNVEPTKQFSVEELQNYPILIATPGFYAGSRGSKATSHNNRRRQLIFFDERPDGANIFDVDTGLIKTVRDRLTEQHTSASDVVLRLTLLHDHLERIWRSAERKSAFDILPNDPALDVGWFASAHTMKYLSSRDEQTKMVFGFARALANGFAFLGRYDSVGKGARFIGYEMNVPAVPGMVILDATADIDGFSFIAKNRQLVPVPQVDFGNLAITHIDPIPLRTKGKKGHRQINEVLTSAERAQPYADFILETIKRHTQPGERVLVVVHKALLAHRYLPTNDDFDAPFDLDGRHVCFVNWGKGIGSNRWRDATAVFLFGEFHKPKRTTVATGLGLREEPATTATLLPYQAWNSKRGRVALLRDGDLCRQMKQMAMRGSARKIDAHGVCGVQRLYVTGELERLVCHAETMFPGASLSVDRADERIRHKGIDALVALLLSTEEDGLSTADIKERTGIDMRKNGKRVDENLSVLAAARLGRWDRIHGTGGKGNMGGFIREVEPNASERNEPRIQQLPSFDFEEA